MQTLGVALDWETAAAALAGALVVALASEALARAKRMPATVFLVPGILPLVPGTRAYQAMLALMSHDHAAAAREGVTALFGAGGIAVGVLLATALARAGAEQPDGQASPRRAVRRSGPRTGRSMPLLWGRRRSRR